MKNFFILLSSLLLLSSCAKTHHFTLYGGKPFDRQHFTVNTNDKGNLVEGNVTARLVAFYIPVSKDTFSPYKVSIATLHALEKTNSTFLIDPYIKLSFYGFFPPLCLYCQGDTIFGGYESIDVPSKSSLEIDTQVTENLRELQQLLDEHLIAPTDYEKKKNEMLKKIN